jgi:hypothetical protein
LDLSDEEDEAAAPTPASGTILGDPNPLPPAVTPQLPAHPRPLSTPATQRADREPLGNGAPEANDAHNATGIEGFLPDVSVRNASHWVHDEVDIEGFEAFLASTPATEGWLPPESRTPEAFALLKQNLLRDQAAMRGDPSPCSRFKPPAGSVAGSGDMPSVALSDNSDAESDVASMPELAASDSDDDEAESASEGGAPDVNVPLHVVPDLHRSVLYAGQSVWYMERTKEWQAAEVLAVDLGHADGQPSYTVRLCNGVERETVRERLRPRTGVPLAQVAGVLSAN